MRKADLVLVLGSSLSVPTACDLPEICLEARDGKPETCRQAKSIPRPSLKFEIRGTHQPLITLNRQGLFLQILPHIDGFH